MKLRDPWKIIIGSSWLLVIFFFTISCTQLNEVHRRRTLEARNNLKKQYVTMARSDSGILDSSSSLKLESKHYVLIFSEDIQKLKDYDSADERRGVGHGSLVYMESLYNFVHDIFGFEPSNQDVYGFEPNQKIRIVLHDFYNGSKHQAVTQTQSRTEYQNGGLIKKITGIQMDFPVEMYNQRPVKAHELAHAFTNIYLLPTWFAEGIAVLVEVEYAEGNEHGKVDLHDDLKLDLDGVNAAQSWRGHGSATLGPLTHWCYNYSYSIVSELKQRYGSQFYPNFFRLIEEDRLHQKLPGAMKDSFLVYYLSQSAGEDLIPFFQNLKFKVSKLSRNDILAMIQQMNLIITQ